MFTINDDLSIYVTRGDRLFFTVTASDNGKLYTFQPGDVVRLKVYGKKDAENVVLQKDFPVVSATEKVEIYLTEDETRIGGVISKPTDYWYEVELNPFDNPQTIIGYDEDGAKIFKLFPEGNELPDYVPDPEDIPVVDKALDMTSTRPVQNQAIARAITRLEAAVSGNQAANTALADEVGVERARLDNLVASAVAPASGDNDYLELADIRVGADGVTYGSAGTAVRQQITEMRNKVESYFDGDGTNILNNSLAVDGCYWEREYGEPSRIYMKEIAGGFCFPAVKLLAGRTYCLTNAALNNVIILDGTWNESNGSYTGNYYRANSCSFVTFESMEGYEGYGRAVVKPTKVCWLFFSSTTIDNIGSPSTSMVFEGAEIPSKFVAYGEHANLRIPGLQYAFKNKQTIIVGKDSNIADYDTIQAACDNANEGDTILVLSGTYNESVVVIDKEVHIVGIDKKNCVLEYHSGSYDYHPLSIARGSVQNMTVRAVKDKGATASDKMPYAVHIDFDYEKDGEMLIDNCVLVGDWQAALGVGMKSNFVLTIKNTDLITNADTTNGAFFFHDNVIDGYNGNARLIVDRCNIRNTVGAIAIMPKSYGSTENKTDMTFVNTLLYSKLGGASNASVGVGRAVSGAGWRSYNNFFLTGDCYGNNIALFNA